MMSQDLVEILTSNEGQDLADKLTTYFGREISITNAENGKKVLCCAKFAVDTTLNLLASTRPLPNAETWNVGLTGAEHNEEFGHLIEGD